MNGYFPEQYEKLLRKLYVEFPRQFGVPKRFDIHSFEELKGNIKIYNGKTTCFTSVYNYSNENRTDVNLNVIVFDFDPDGIYKPFDEMRKLYDYCKMNDYKSMVVFSGGGFHYYVYASNGNKLKNPKQALTNVHKAIITDTGISADTSLVGDLSQLIRIPGTRNVKRKRWCCFIDEDDIKQGFEYIQKYAEENRFGHYRVFGKRLLNIANYDTAPTITPSFEINKEETKLIEQSKILTAVRPCTAHILLKLKTLSHSYHERLAVIAEFRQMGFMRSQVKEMLKDFLPEHKWRHCVLKISGGEGQVDYIYDRGLVAMSCKRLKDEGWCPKGGCEHETYR